MNEARGGLERLTALVERLRAPDGCPWDRQQELADLRAYLLEEAHEVAAAIDAGDFEELAGELGDLLFQVAFVVTLARERGAFDGGAVVDRIEAKMIDRHPHVFGDELLTDAAAVRRAWERRKVDRDGATKGLLDGVAPSLPALVQSYRLTQKAAGVGFDWSRATDILGKIDEELAEVRQELAAATPPDRASLAAEVGDLLFTVANLARHLEIDPEAALAGTNLKFRRRFAHIERRLAAQARSLNDASLEEMDALWDEAKAAEQGDS